MRSLSRTLLMAVLALCVLAPVAHAAPRPAADVEVTPEALYRLGIRSSRLAIGVVSDDGRVVVCYEKERDPKVIAQGKVYRLHLFNVDWAKGTYTHDALWVPVTRFEQLAITPDNRWILVVGESGWKFVGVDVAARKVHVIASHQPDTAGFRTNPLVTWVQDGRIHTVGYFIDEKEVVTGDAVVSIDPAATGEGAFHKVRDITALVRRTNNFRNAEWFAADQAYFAGYEPDKKIHLYAYVGKDNLVPLEAALGYDGMAVGQDRIVYAARRGPVSGNVVVADVATGKRWSVGESTRPYRYLYMSRDGKTILTSIFEHAAGTMTTWYAREADDFKLHPLPQVQKAPPGTMRFSPGGEVFLFFNNKGLHICRVPR